MCRAYTMHLLWILGFTWFHLHWPKTVLPELFSVLVTWKSVTPFGNLLNKRPGVNRLFSSLPRRDQAHTRQGATY